MLLESGSVEYVHIEQAGKGISCLNNGLRTSITSGSANACRRCKYYGVVVRTKEIGGFVIGCGKWKEGRNIEGKDS